MDNYQELISEATVIKNENAPRENTANRIGSAFINVINAMKGIDDDLDTYIATINSTFTSLRSEIQNKLNAAAIQWTNDIRNAILALTTKDIKENGRSQETINADVAAQFIRDAAQWKADIQTAINGLTTKDIRENGKTQEKINAEVSAKFVAAAAQWADDIDNGFTKRKIKGFTTKPDDLNSASDMGIYYMNVNAGYNKLRGTGLLSVGINFSNIVYQTFLSTNIPVYDDDGNITSFNSKACILSRYYQNGAWTQWKEQIPELSTANIRENGRTQEEINKTLEQKTNALSSELHEGLSLDNLAGTSSIQELVNVTLSVESQGEKLNIASMNIPGATSDKAGVMTAQQSYLLSGLSKVVKDLEHLTYKYAICESGSLSIDGKVIPSSYFVSYFYPTKNLARANGHRFCFYDKDMRFISYTDNATSGEVIQPNIPENAEFIRIWNYTQQITVAYFLSNFDFASSVKLYNIRLNNDSKWWFGFANIANRKASSLHFGRCLIKLPVGNYQMYVIHGTSFTEPVVATGWVKTDVLIDADEYWRVAIAKTDNTDFADGEIPMLIVEQNNKTFEQKIPEIAKATIYDEINICNVTIPDIGDYPNVTFKHTFKPGKYNFKVVTDVKSAPISVLFCKDNLNTANRILQISNATSFSITINEEQASLINVIGFISVKPYVPVQVNFSYSIGSLSDTISSIGSIKIHNRRKLIGATFFDGWSYQCWLENYRNSNRIYQMSELYDNSGLLNTPELAAKYEAEFGKKMILDESSVRGLNRNGGIDGSGNKLTSWVDYVWATTGKYPPGSVSFSNYFPDVAYSLRGKAFICGDGSYSVFMPPHNHNYEPIRTYTMKDGTTTNGLTSVNLGWRNTDTIDQMEAQIDMASYYGLDYFNFCLILTKNMIIDGNVDEELFFNGVKDMSVNVRGWSERGNHGLVNFLKAKNSYKMKFCLMILSSYKTLDDVSYSIFMNFIYEKFITDNRYLHFNGRPILLWYSEKYGSSFSKIYHMNRDIISHFVNGSVGKFDGTFTYTGSGNVETELDHEDANGYKYYKYRPSVDAAVASINKTIPTLIPINIGWHSSQRSNFANNTYCDLHSSTAEVVTDYHEIIMPTKAEIIKGLSDVFNAYFESGSDCLILIYAWNECGEGGYLLPNQAEIDSTDPERSGFYKLEAVQEFKNLL